MCPGRRLRMPRADNKYRVGMGIRYARVSKGSDQEADSSIGVEGVYGGRFDFESDQSQWIDAG